MDGVAPKQTRPKMIVRTFRVPESKWEALIETCERNEENPTDVLRRAVDAYLEANTSPDE